MPTALITGGSRGIGLALVEKYSMEGWDVYAPTRHEMDLSIDYMILTYCLELRRNGVKLDLLIHNAGLYKNQAFTKNLQREVIMVNLYGPISLTWDCLHKDLLTPEAQIIAMSSMDTLTLPKNQCFYNTSKAGLEAFMQSLAGEHPHLHFNILRVGLCYTGMFDPTLPINYTPKTPEEVANFLYTKTQLNQKDAIWTI